MSDTWQMTAYYNDKANAIWRRKHPQDKRPGPHEGEIAIQVRGSHTVCVLDSEAAGWRDDIGIIDLVQIR